MDHDHVPIHEDRDAEINHKSPMTGPHPGNGNKSTNTEPVAKVVERLFVLLEDPTMGHLIKWTTDGKYFVVVDEQGLMDIAGFKTKKFESLHKQLNNYGFHKKKKSRKAAKGELANGAWYHERFLRGRPDLLREVGRRDPVAPVGPADDSQPAPPLDGTKLPSPLPNFAVPHQMGVAGCACEGQIAGLTREVIGLTRVMNLLLALPANKFVLDILRRGHPDAQAMDASHLAAQSVNQSLQSPSSAFPQHTHTASQQGSSPLEQVPSSFVLAENSGYYPSNVDHNPRHTLLQYSSQNPPISPSVQTPYSLSPDGQTPSVKKRRIGPIPGSNSSASQIRPDRAGPSTAPQAPSLVSGLSLPFTRRAGDQVALPNPSYNNSGDLVDTSRSHPSMLSQPRSCLQFHSRGIDHWAETMVQVPRPDKPPAYGTGGSGWQ
ncbi:hypothetical protein FRB93_000065 [Tulasnella sp. JGI-2019a]|nr:hypothetical protein FRB93_000065 [Tulasnella sp. JGI-2019a]